MLYRVLDDLILYLVNKIAGILGKHDNQRGFVKKCICILYYVLKKLSLHHHVCIKTKSATLLIYLFGIGGSEDGENAEASSGWTTQVRPL